MKEHYVKTESGEDLQITSDGQTVWVNGKKGCIARFSAKGWEIWSATRQPRQKLLDSWAAVKLTGVPWRMEWERFAALMVKHHKVVLADSMFEYLGRAKKKTLPLAIRRKQFKRSLSLELKEHSSDTRSDLLFSGPHVEVKLLTTRPRRKLIFKALIPGGFTEGDVFGREMADKLARTFFR